MVGHRGWVMIGHVRSMVVWSSIGRGLEKEVLNFNCIIVHKCHSIRLMSLRLVTSLNDTALEPPSVKNQKYL